MRKLALAAVALLVTAATLSAQATPPQKPADQKIDGNWSMSLTGPDGNAMPITLVLKSDGKKVTGTLTGPQGDTALEGEYADRKLKFGISVNIQGQAMDIGFAGDMKDDGTMAGVATGPFGELQWTAARAK